MSYTMISTSTALVSYVFYAMISTSTALASYVLHNDFDMDSVVVVISAIALFLLLVSLPLFPYQVIWTGK